ncbi:hypothetical protein FNW02_11820 [Komarekiella sp. 'clone 1']|uniref:Uncharacterized protein n=1 Tax=Komarekiella delphini-convector SJRDD-AB1 TaxID=2593771 RepID=A0AA40SWX5_9NOST|nr:hypothetical protein [Komarekiella delphini-convector SJRDD-AB1]
MKSSLHSLVLLSSLALFTINFTVSQPANAAIVCEPGIINRYSNGSLANCLLGQNVTVQFSSSHSGISNFPCKANSYISFDEKGQFKSCTISEESKIRKSNSVETCLAEFQVEVSVSNDGNQSISCWHY